MVEKQNPPKLDNLPKIDAKKGTAIKKVVEFLDTHLPTFPSYFRQGTTSIKIKSEDDISQELYVYLQRLTYSEPIFMFQFQRKYLNSRRSSDFGVITVEHNNSLEPSRAFFYIEAKRLPTPGSGREREYVEGNLGGIERYKRGHHGDKLAESAIIGYIQKNNCNYWSQEINTWINDLISAKTLIDILWNLDDLLAIEKDLITTQKHSSKNTRIVGSVKDSIKLHHYLMNLV